MLVELTTSQLMALKTILVEVLQCPDVHHAQVHINVTADPPVETTPGDILKALMDQDPL